MKAFRDEIILMDEHSSIYNVSLTQEFQGIMAVVYFEEEIFTKSTFIYHNFFDGKTHPNITFNQGVLGVETV